MLYLLVRFTNKSGKSFKVKIMRGLVVIVVLSLTSCSTEPDFSMLIGDWKRPGEPFYEKWTAGDSESILKGVSFYLNDENSSFVEVMDIMNLDEGYYLNAKVFE